MKTKLKYALLSVLFVVLCFGMAFGAKFAVEKVTSKAETTNYETIEYEFNQLNYEIRLDNLTQTIGYTKILFLGSHAYATQDERSNSIPFFNNGYWDASDKVKYTIFIPKNAYIIFDIGQYRAFYIDTTINAGLSVVPNENLMNGTEYIYNENNGGGVVELYYLKTDQYMLDYDRASITIVQYKTAPDGPSEDEISEAYNAGYDTGYRTGYNTGLTEGLETAENGTFYDLMSAVVGAPVGVVKDFLNFEILDVNMLAFFSGIITLMIIVKILKMII